MASEDAQTLKKEAKTTTAWAALNGHHQPYICTEGTSTLIKLPLNGFWFHTKAGQAVLKICGSSIGIRQAGPVEFNGGPSHGNGTVYFQSSGHVKASIDFHQDQQEEDLKHHSLKEMVPGIFQSRDRHTFWICPDRLDPYAAAMQKVVPADVDETCVSNFAPGKLVIASDHLPFCIEKLEEFSGQRVSKVFLWMHSGRDLAYLLVMTNSEVIWCNWDGSDYSPVAHGQACYSYINPDIDVWHVRFHCRSQMCHAKAHLLLRVTSSTCSECHLWRSCRNEYKTVLDVLKSQGALPDVANVMYDSNNQACVCMLEMSVKSGRVAGAVRS